MKTLSKLNIEPEKLLKKDELAFLKGGVESENCPCGTGVQTWYCNVMWQNHIYYGGIACGSQAYITEVAANMPDLGEGWHIDCHDWGYCNGVPS